MKRLFTHKLLFALLLFFFTTQVYSQNFSHYSFLPNRTTLNFSGAQKSNGVELTGILSASHTYNKLIIEKGSNGTNYLPIQEMSISNNSTAEFSFSFFDNSSLCAVSYYRIRLLNTSQFIQEVSNVLMVKRGALVKSLELQNTLIRINNPVLNISAVKNTEATINMLDMSGKIIFSKKVKLNSGLNCISAGIVNTSQSFGIVIFETTEERTTTKIIFQ